MLLVPVPAAPFVVVPPIPVDEPKPPLELESVPPIGDVEEPLFPIGELDDPDPKEDPLLPNPDPEEPSEELPLLAEVPGDPAEDPKGEDDPNPPAVPVPVVVEAPVGVIPFCCTDWPNKPMAGTFCSPL